MNNSDQNMGSIKEALEFLVHCKKSSLSSLFEEEMPRCGLPSHKYKKRNKYAQEDKNDIKN